MSRTRAGVRYPSDSIDGPRLDGAAVRFLEDRPSLPDRIDDVRLSLETFDGERSTVEPTVGGQAPPQPRAGHAETYWDSHSWRAFSSRRPRCVR